MSCGSHAPSSASAIMPRTLPNTWSTWCTARISAIPPSRTSRPRSSSAASMERHNGSTAARAPSLLNRRAINLLGGLAAVLLMGYALYEQHVVGLQPCHLCILQRIAVLGLGVVFLLAAAHDPGDAGARIYAVLLAVIAGAGLAAAGRHVWLQLQPAGSVP